VAVLRTACATTTSCSARVPQVFFKMRVAGVLHIFQFETRQVCAVAPEPCLY
jgi:hypothetical protein